MSIYTAPQKIVAKLWRALGSKKDNITSLIAILVVIIGFIEYRSRSFDLTIDRALGEIEKYRQSPESKTESAISFKTASGQFWKGSRVFGSNRKEHLGEYFLTNIFKGRDGIKSREETERDIIKLLKRFQSISTCANSGACNRQVLCDHFAIEMDHFRCQLRYVFFDWTKKWGLCLTDEIDEFLDRHCVHQMRKLHGKQEMIRQSYSQIRCANSVYCTSYIRALQIMPMKNYGNLSDNTCFKDMQYFPKICKSYIRAIPNQK